jgi:hypothetical protein
LDKAGKAHRPNGQFANKNEIQRTTLEKFGDKAIGLNKF